MATLSPAHLGSSCCPALEAEASPPPTPVSLIFPACLPAECRRVWENAAELAGLLMKASSRSLHSWDFSFF